MSMKSRCVVVTGASGNLGAAVVERLERAGARVVGLTRGDADLTDEGQVEAAYEKALQRQGAIWGSVHCAGGWAGASFAQTEIATFERMIDLNLRSAFLCCRAALRRMRGEG
ncbi:MAG: SDR family NAD(P)-dependent oxidoreductase, partial [Myxococcales bacterium]